MPKFVRATRPGLYGSYREVGSVFEVQEDRHFSSIWMEKTSKPDPLDHDNDGRKGGSVPAVDDGLGVLRDEARSLGVEVDNRWGEKRLRSEIDKALAN